MPCTAKKYEASRPELGRDGYQDVDYVLTTRELAKLIRYVGLDLSVLPESEFDSPLGTGSGAGAIFGATGGVMEAALRTAYFSHLYRIVHCQYTGRTQKVLLRALGEQIDLLNIIHVLRLKTYFPRRSRRPICAFSSPFTTASTPTSPAPSAPPPAWTTSSPCCGTPPTGLLRRRGGGRGGGVLPTGHLPLQQASARRRAPLHLHRRGVPGAQGAGAECAD